MKDSPTTSIAVADLRIGMFVHLDLGWMDHPFPLSSFKISSQQQIDTIRSLGGSYDGWGCEVEKGQFYSLCRHKRQLRPTARLRA